MHDLLGGPSPMVSGLRNERRGLGAEPEIANAKEPSSVVSSQKLRCPVDSLSLGMYVSELDRPWLETPFLFQGFKVQDNETLGQLREHCEFVFIDPSQCDGGVSLDAVRAGARTTVDEPLPLRNGNPQQLNTDERELKRELVEARKAHESAEQVVDDIFSRIEAGKAIDLGNVQEALDPMIESIFRNDDAMSWLARMKRKNDYIYDHSLSSSVWAMMLGKHLGFAPDEIKVLGMGAMFMDVGKTGIPTELLVRNGPLDDEEKALMRSHVEQSVSIVSGIEGIDPRVEQMVRLHHERFNGQGYPDGIAGSDIPMFARIAGLVDTYDAMTASRPYAQPQSTYDAMRQLNRLSSVEFAEELVEQFVQAIGVFPVGSLVELNTGEVGIVIAQNRVRRLRPKVMVVLDESKNPLQIDRIVDLRDTTSDASLWIDSGLAPGDFGVEPSEFYL
jgi:HD-GYP domain-containing protein (c-di-GMP phosphodiesterase class II)